jgi:hypothetical protein
MLFADYTELRYFSELKTADVEEMTGSPSCPISIVFNLKLPSFWVWH